MKRLFILLFFSTVVLSACQSTQTQTLSKAQANTTEAFRYLPLLTVKNIEKTSKGCKVKLLDEQGQPFLAVVNKTELGDSYPTLKSGDTVKIEGDYTDSEPVQIHATKVVFVR